MARCTRIDRSCLSPSGPPSTGWLRLLWPHASRVPSLAPPVSPLWRVLHAINRRPWVLLLVLCLISVVLLPVMEVEAVESGGTYYGDRIFGALAVAIRTSAWVPALIALGIASGFLHYWLDRAVYRLSRPSVRLAARGLLSADLPVTHCQN